MREIKLRWTFKCKDDGHIYQIVGDVGLLGEYNGLTEMFKNELWELVGRDQFTGLLDKDGKEVYEGDIVSSPLFDGEENDKQVVVWDNYSSGFATETSVLIADGQFEVIGNLYETPELIKAEE